MWMIELETMETRWKDGKRYAEVPGFVEVPAGGLDLAAMRIPHGAGLFVPSDKKEAILDRMFPAGNQGEKRERMLSRIVRGSVCEINLRPDSMLNLPEWFEAGADGRVIAAKIGDVTKALLVCRLSLKVLSKVLDTVILRMGDGA